MKKILLFVFLIAWTGTIQIFSQTYVDISNTSTCDQALDISRFSIFGPTTAPEEDKNINISTSSLIKNP